MAKYALLVIDTGKNDTSADGIALRNLADTIASSPALQQQSTSYKRMNIGAYQINLARGLDSLSQIHTIAKSSGFSVHTLFFDDEPTWVTSKHSDCDEYRA